jgi:hypothetical protein
VTGQWSDCSIRTQNGGQDFDDENSLVGHGVEGIEGDVCGIVGMPGTAAWRLRKFIGRRGGGGGGENVMFREVGIPGKGE